MSKSSQNNEITYLSSLAIRQKFLDFFEKKQHQVVKSSSLVPFNDESLLFTNSGMVQFKNVLSGKEKRNYKRAVSVQKCIRAGGKHNDLENIGYTARHHTFFEMLGNFSFGDYFKEEAISFAWEFLTVELAIPANRLWVSVYFDDDEAVKIWTDKIGFPIERISRCNEDNFWQMGDTGPCGPCSEIFFDHGAHIKGGPPGSADEDGDRYTEIWNLVFTQFNRTTDGQLEKLPKPSVDTGMGLERVSAVLQSVTNNYHTDLFIPIIDFVSKKLGVNKDHPSVKVLADHIRSCSFLITDGVYPGNESRNYVLRRIIRRAIRHAHKLGASSTKGDLFFYCLLEPLIATMKGVYPELKNKRSQIIKILKAEEQQFSQTLEIGIRLLNQEIKKNLKYISAEICFNLYDTHGFPVDLTADIAREHHLKVDLAGFNELMNQQKMKSKKSSTQFKNNDLELVLDLKEKTEFVGYEQFNSSAKIKAIISNTQFVNLIQSDSTHKKESNNDKKEKKIALVLDNTPFYPESGGQVADCGQLTKINKNGEIEAIFKVNDTQKYADSILHFGKLVSGEIKIGDELKANINQFDRNEIAKHHSATHLLQAALIEVFGSSIEQKGSLVQADKLRFDFSYSKALTLEEIEKVESLVNQQILLSVTTRARVMKKRDALKTGAKATFGEKYGDEVRVLSIGQKINSKINQSKPFSLELCGGTHIDNTAKIGLFKIISESSISAGIRRIEAVCGKKAIELFNKYQKIISNNSKIIQGPIEKQSKQIKQLQDKLKNITKELELLNKKLSSYQMTDLIDQAEKIESQYSKPVSIITAIVAWDKKTTMNAIDYLKNKLNPAIIVISNKTSDKKNPAKINLFCAVSQDLQNQFKANQLIEKFTKPLNGRGGGRGDMAQAGLVDKNNQLEKLFFQFKKEIKKSL